MSLNFKGSYFPDHRNLARPYGQSSRLAERPFLADSCRLVSATDLTKLNLFQGESLSKPDIEWAAESYQT